MITVHMEAGKVTVKGHAGYAPPGQDIYCAAVSTLAYTLVESLRRVCPDGSSFRAEPGSMEIICEDNEKTRAVFAFAEDGFRPLAQQNPDYIAFSKKQ